MNDVESIPGSCLAFGGTASVGLSAKKKKRNVKKSDSFNMQTLFLSHFISSL